MLVPSRVRPRRRPLGGPYPGPPENLPRQSPLIGAAPVGADDGTGEPGPERSLKRRREQLSKLEGQTGRGGFQSESKSPAKVAHHHSPTDGSPIRQRFARFQQRLNRVVEPTGQVRDDWEIIRDLMLAISGESNEIHHIEDIFKVLAENVTEFKGLTLSKIGHQGTQIAETGYQIQLLANERARKAAGLING